MSDLQHADPHSYTAPRARIVVVDDDATMAGLLSDVLREEGHDANTYTDPMAARDAILADPPSLVITDMRMGHFDGMTLIDQVAAAHPGLPVILVTAYGSVDTAIEATRRGAYHFITKPFRLKEVLLVVDRALTHRRMQVENARLRREIDTRDRFGGLIGRSAPMRRVFELIERVAGASSNVLVLGESGTGKELVARAIHQSSARKSQPFVAVNCSALPEGLLESELFGHVRGAFTGAHANKVGLFQEASSGTLFLDEIGDMPLPLQAKLLRAIQEKSIRPVGGNRELTVDTRIVAATHQDLRELVRQGRFREDLYYRLSVIPVELPPLRARSEDIPLLVNHFIDQIARGLGVPPKPVDHAAMMTLMRLPWEGNVRELQNVIERAHVLSRGQVITPIDIPALEGAAAAEHPPPVEPTGGQTVTSEPQTAAQTVLPPMFGVPPPQAGARPNGESGLLPVLPHGQPDENWPSLEAVELRYIIEVMKHTRGNKDRAALILGIDRRTLYRWRNRHELDAAVKEQLPRRGRPAKTPQLQ